MGIKKIFVLAMVFATFFTARIAGADEGTAKEEENPWTVELDMPFNSKYIWRGMNLGDDWVFQPSFEAGYQWVSIMVWANMQLTDEVESMGGSNRKGEFTEIDYMLHLTPQLGIVRFEAGAYWYTFPNTEFDPTVEVYAGLGLDVISQPTLLVYYDVELAHGFYTEFTLSHTFEGALELTDSIGMSVDLEAHIGLGDTNHDEFYYMVPHDGLKFTDTGFYVGFPLSFGDHVTFTPAVSYSVIVDQEIRDMFEEMEIEAENFVYGAGLRVSL